MWIFTACSKYARQSQRCHNRLTPSLEHARCAGLAAGAPLAMLSPQSLPLSICYSCQCISKRVACRNGLTACAYLVTCNSSAIDSSRVRRCVVCQLWHQNRASPNACHTVCNRCVSLVTGFLSCYFVVLSLQFDFEEEK